MSLTRFRALLVVLCFALLSVACKNVPKIEGTDIPDTEDNRQIIFSVERFRTAFARKDAAMMLASAHPTYLDEAGTEDPSDDVGYEELGSLLRRRLAQIESLRFTIDYLRISVQGDRATVDVWIDAAFRMKPLLDADGGVRAPPRYSRKQDHARFELVRDGESWLITSGM